MVVTWQIGDGCSSHVHSLEDDVSLEACVSEGDAEAREGSSVAVGEEEEVEVVSAVETER